MDPLAISGSVLAIIMLAVAYRYAKAQAEERRESAANKEQVRHAISVARRINSILYHRAYGAYPLEDIVEFFNVTSEQHDSSIFREAAECAEDDTTARTLRQIQAVINGAGRCSVGINRTEAGERVTREKVYLGDIYGLWTKPIPFWEERKDQEKGGWGYSGMEHLNSYDVVARQAQEFMRANQAALDELVGKLAMP